MTLGPTKIVACPHCQALATYRTLDSGNTFGARYWTDGKQIAPMLPLPPAFVRCRYCVNCFWLADAKEVGEFPWELPIDNIDPAWLAAEDVEEPTEDQYFAAIAGKPWTEPEQERFLRILAWHRANEAFRDDPNAETVTEPNMSRALANNLEILSELLNETDQDDLIMKAEVLRQLGNFPVALQLLDRIDEPEYRQIVHQLRALCRRRDSRVRELRFEQQGEA